MLRPRLFRCFVVNLFYCALFMRYGKADPLPYGSQEEDRVELPDVTNHKNLNLLPRQCGHYELESKITNGKDAGLTEYPWMALFQYRKKDRTFYGCGGSIINKNYILTAAHCVAGLKDKELIAIRVGEHTISNETDYQILEDNTEKRNPPVQDLSIDETITHPKYINAATGNDIALVRVSTINLEVENARPVCLPIGSARDQYFNKAWIAGWGVTNITTGKQSNVLQKALVPVPDEGSCAPFEDTFKTQICSLIVNGTDSCSGDSGGPVVVPTVLDEGPAYVQQGIVSYGIRACGYDYKNPRPSVYTRVTYYMDWILDNIKA